MQHKSSTVEDDEEEDLPQTELERLNAVLPEGLPIVLGAASLTRQPSGGEDGLKLTNKEKFDEMKRQRNLARAEVRRVVPSMTTFRAPRCPAVRLLRTEHSSVICSALADAAG